LRDGDELPNSTLELTGERAAGWSLADLGFAKVSGLVDWQVWASLVGPQLNV
jgi:hypothetical protein